MSCYRKVNWEKCKQLIELHCTGNSDTAHAKTHQFEKALCAGNWQHRQIKGQFLWFKAATSESCLQQRKQPLTSWKADVATFFQKKSRLCSSSASGAWCFFFPGRWPWLLILKLVLWVSNRAPRTQFEWKSLLTDWPNWDICILASSLNVWSSVEWNASPAREDLQTPKQEENCQSSLPRLPFIVFVAVNFWENVYWRHKRDLPDTWTARVFVSFALGLFGAVENLCIWHALMPKMQADPLVLVLCETTMETGQKTGTQKCVCFERNCGRMIPVSGLYPDPLSISRSFTLKTVSFPIRAYCCIWVHCFISQKAGLWTFVLRAHTQSPVVTTNP